MGIYKSVYKLMGGMRRVPEAEAMAEYALTGRMPVGWQAAADGGLEEVRIPLEEALDATQGENALGRGVLGFLGPDEVANFRGLGRRERLLATEFRAPLPERLQFRELVERGERIEQEEAEADFEMLLKWLQVHPNPAKLVFPYKMATVENIQRIGRRVIPEIDLNCSPDESLEDDKLDEMGNSPVADALSLFEGARKLWIDETPVGDVGLAPFHERLEALEAIDSMMTDASFPYLVRLQSLSCGLKRFTNYGRVPFQNFAPLTALRELKLEGKPQGISDEAFATLPLSLEKLAVLHAPGLTSAHLARLRVRKLELTRCDAVTDVPATVQDLTLQVCAGFLRDSLAGRRFEKVALFQQDVVPQFAFARDLSIYSMDLIRELDAEGNATNEIPDCEELLIAECESFSIDSLRKCRSLRSITLLETPALGFVPREFFERLRALCPLLVVLKIDRASLRNVLGRPSQFRFDLQLL